MKYIFNWLFSIPHGISKDYIFKYSYHLDALPLIASIPRIFPPSLFFKSQCTEEYASKRGICCITISNTPSTTETIFPEEF